MKNTPKTKSGQFLYHPLLVVSALAAGIFIIGIPAEAKGKTWLERQTGITPSHPLPRISRNDLNREIKKIGIDPIKPLGKAGDKTVFAGWKPFRTPLLPAERAATEAMNGLADAEKYLVLFVESMLWNRHWPEGFPRQTPRLLKDPSIEVAIPQNTINRLTNLYKGEVIPLAGGDFVEIGDARLKLDADRGVYVLEVSGGKVVYKFVRENSFHIKGATFECVPVITPAAGKAALGFAVRCVYLDIEKCPGEIDRFIAHVITEALASRNNGVVATVDITQSLTTPVNLGTQSKMIVVPQLTDASAFIRGQTVVAQAAFTLTKRAALPSRELASNTQPR